MGLVGDIVEVAARKSPALAFYLLAAYLVYCIAIGLYNVTLNPLAGVPGPKFRAALHFAEAWEVWTGDAATNWKALHDQYGPIVRVAPRKVSFNSADAWHDIYGQTAERKPIPKDKEVYFSGNDGIADIISADDADHARIRRLLSHALSEIALREQEPILNSYFDLLIRKLGDQVDGPAKGKVELVRWFNFTTFDLIGDLAFAEPFHSLRDEEYHTWVAQIFKGLKFARLFRIFRLYPLIGMPVLATLALFPALSKARYAHAQYTKEKTARRMDMGTDRKDFMSYVLRHNDEKGMTRAEITKTSGTLIVAGSETTATVLSGAVFHLLKNPEKMERLTIELRSRFSDAATMDITSLARLLYLNACLRETFRIYPPVPGPLPRRTQTGGAVIAGYFIPENVSVAVHGLSTYRSASNFSDPDEYIPERWLGDARYKDDQKPALQPFSIGPRGCLGQHLAWAEIRGILARVLWNFDLELCTESEDWDRQKVFILWEKLPLMVQLRRRDV